jgi:hypothetical protein
LATDNAPLKVSKVTKERIRLGAAVYGQQHAEFAEAAIDEFIEKHKPELQAGLLKAGETLGINVKLDDIGGPQ